jgi:hypothetical protein
MNLAECIEWQRVNAHHIDRLAHQGDREANKLISAYRELYRHQLDVKLQNEFVACCNEYVKRDLTITERDELANRFGHKVQE